MTTEQIFEYVRQSATRHRCHCRRTSNNPPECEVRSFLDSYWASRDGKIFQYINGRWMELRPQITEKGYAYVYVKNNGARKRWLVNRAVALAWHGAPPTPHHHAAHCNGNRLDNRAENLAWKTALENNHDKRIHGTQSSILTPEQALFAKQSTEPARMVASLLGVSVKTIQAIRSGRIWKSVTEAL